MHTSIWLGLFLSSICLVGCSKSPAPQSHTTGPQTPSTATPDLPSESTHVLRAKLTAAGIPTEYAAMFEANQLAQIVEHRRSGGEVLAGEYAFKGARLIEYRGARLTDAAPLDLQFDMQGILLSGQTPTVSEEDIRAIRNRAQLLRSHALAQRATRQH